MKMKKKAFDYFGSLITMSNFALQEAQMLKNIFHSFSQSDLEKRLDEMHELEHGCDRVKHAMTTELVKDFLPPVDREDLFRLAHVTDNLTDRVENVLTFLYMANIKQLRDDINIFADMLIECCECVVKALEEFENFKKSEKLRDCIIALNDFEEKADKLYISSVRRLSCESRDARAVIEWRDVYEKFEHCFDAAESVADNIESIVMKNS